MATSPSKSDSPTVNLTQAQSNPAYWIDALFLAAFAAHIPVGIEYCKRMWVVGHYQFFPLLAAAAGWLIYDRLAHQVKRKPRTSTTYLLLTASAVFSAVAVLLYAPFFWIGSLLFLLLVYIYDRWGTKGLWYTAPAWLLLLFIVPLPSNLDLKIINKMQFMSSQLASWILDAFGQVHFREGVVLITEEKQFFTEEACSGIRSLFSSLAAISIYGVMRRYPLWRHGFNLVQTVLWVIVGNAIRVAGVVYLADNVNESFASGTTHEMLGLGAFLFIFLCAMSTDRGINAWQASTIDFTDDALRTDTEEPVVEGQVKKEVLVGQTDSVPGFKWALIAVFGLITLFGARLAYAKIAEDQLNYYSDDDLIVLLESDLPETINGWQRSSFSHQRRDDTRLLAPESYIWTYLKEGRKVTISLDSPYYDFHNLNDCYEGFGWDVDYEHSYPEGNNDLNTKVNLTELKMEKTSEYGVVLFTAFDRRGQLVRPTFEVNYAPTRLMQIKRHINLAMGTLDQDNDPRLSKKPLPITQVQLLHTSGRTIADKAELDGLFIACRGILQKSRRFTETP
ncbi:MAG: exosortase U [Planctomycetota bacterium]